MGQGGDNIENIFQRICGKLTHHKWRVGECHSEGIVPNEYHYRCHICKYRFWNFKPFKGAPPQVNGYDPDALDKMLKATTSLSVNKTLSDSEWSEIVDSINNSLEGCPLVFFEEAYDLIEHNEVNE